MATIHCVKSMQGSSPGSEYAMWTWKSVKLLWPMNHGKITMLPVNVIQLLPDMGAGEAWNLRRFPESNCQPTRLLKWPKIMELTQKEIKKRSTRRLTFWVAAWKKCHLFCEKLSPFHLPHGPMFYPFNRLAFRWRGRPVYPWKLARRPVHPVPSGSMEKSTNVEARYWCHSLPHCRGAHRRGCEETPRGAWSKMQGGVVRHSHWACTKFTQK